MQYRQTKIALIVKALTLWWWFGVMLMGIPIVIDILRYKRTRLVLKDRSLTLHEGIITENSRELAYKNIQTVDVHQSVIGQMLNYGHIIITTANQSNPITFKYVDKPQVLRRVIQDRL